MTTDSITLLYDGECPFCSREVQWLKDRDRQGRLALVDISAIGFDPSRYGLTRDEVDSRLHAIRDDGTVARGMDAVCEAYRAVGLGWVVAATRWPGLRTATDWAYSVFARNRVRWGSLLGRQCDQHCSSGRNS